MSTYQYWQHFLALESDFADTARYVEFTADNFGTYSIEFTKLFLAACSEIDVLCKVICKRINESSNAKTIDAYRPVMQNRRAIDSEQVLIRRYNLEFAPWSAWGDDKTPKWWSDHQAVKHNRDEHFRKANLENVANAISGLFVVVLYCHKIEASPANLDSDPVLLGRSSDTGALLLGPRHHFAWTD